MSNELKVIGLGCQNEWDMNNPPELYTQHMQNCGTVRKSLVYNGNPNTPTEYEYRAYNIKHVNLGRCYNSYTCQDCGIQYSVDSSD